MEADFVKVEEQILKRWQEQKAFEKSLQKRRKNERFVFYEGPPTANGAPGIHHVLSRAFKDVVCRYKTMRGFYVGRKAGWDTHGLPVELEIEKKLGLKSKKEIEQYGIAKFNKACRDSVWKYKKEWENLTDRIGFWLDQEHPYITYETEYMESLWWIVKQFWGKGLLYKDYKVVPYCPRCGTPESSHEVAQGYRTVTDQAVTVKFLISNSKSLNKLKIKNAKLKIYLLAWTTTPWTLPGNVALAVGKDITYAVVQKGEEAYIVAKNLLSKLEGKYKVLKEISGKELQGIEYEPLFDALKSKAPDRHYVALADFVSTDEGTGIVHTAVMYGEDDYRLGQKLNLPKQHTVDEEGKFNELVPKWKGVLVKDADRLIVADLQKRNLLYKEELYEHEYPFCWRCGTHVLYYAKDSWFVNMQKVKKELIANNESINWIPPHIKRGRMGEWLAEVKDWAFSRERYWGTPLPVWECENCKHREVIGSREDLRRQTHSRNTYYILRHGHSERQLTNILSSWPEKKPLSLTPKGTKQIKKIANLLKHKKIDLIVSSDLRRTKQTAAILAKELGLKVRVEKRLREADMGVFNGKPVDEFGAHFRKEDETPLQHYLRRFQEGPLQGETWAQVQRRLFELVQEIEQKYKGKTIVFVSHEVPLTLFEGLLKGYTREEVVKFRAKGAIATGELRKLEPKLFPYSDEMEIDLHRPYIDAVEFECAKCPPDGEAGKQGQMKRVKDVVDVWYDSGAMPYAQAHWPFAWTKAQSSKLKAQKLQPPNEYPADYITEAIDQTRGWFYTLLAVATALGLKAPYKNVISLGHLLDEKGEKMSKSKGNVVDPWDMVGKYGVDALRWYFYTLNHPWDSKLFAERDIQQTMRKFMLTLWNSFMFYQTYKPKGVHKIPDTRYQIQNTLDRWVISRLHSTIKETTTRFDDYDITGAARLIEGFVIDDLSLWYIRRSRTRFQSASWQTKSKKELQEASSVLGYVLLETSKLTAPFIPFLSEYIYGELGHKGSVHWEYYPKANAKRILPKLEKEMAQLRAWVTKGLAERAKAGMKVRQPLALLKIQDTRYKIQDTLLHVLKDELNVKELVFDKNLKRELAFDTRITPQLKEEGLLREILRNIQDLRKEAGYRPGEKAVLWYEGDKEIKKLFEKHQKIILQSSSLQKMIAGWPASPRGERPQKFDKEKRLTIDSANLTLGLRKL